jgi:hypothetical protein
MDDVKSQNPNADAFPRVFASFAICCLRPFVPQEARTREKGVDAAREQLHCRIVEAEKAGESKSAIARAAGVSRQWVSRVLGGS